MPSYLVTGSSRGLGLAFVTQLVYKIVASRLGLRLADALS
jgi:NAD(P)-dependent dehydrogenase (short-subunit alcohol dehydrogenase family)